MTACSSPPSSFPLYKISHAVDKNNNPAQYLNSEVINIFKYNPKFILDSFNKQQHRHVFLSGNQILQGYTKNVIFYTFIKYFLWILHYEKRNMAPGSNGCSLMKQNDSESELVKASGTKRPEPECLMNSPAPHLQTPLRNNGPHLVYVRKQHKTTMCNKSKDLPIKLYEQDEKQNHEQGPMNDSVVNIPKAVSQPHPSSEGFSSVSKWRKLDCTQRLSVQYWEERFFLLQNLLKVLDRSTQDDYSQMLRSLSSVDRSRLAVELEKRTVQLSQEEAKEVQRAKVLDVQGMSESKK